MFCSKCGNKLGDGDVFCSACGHKISNINAGVPENNQDVTGTSKGEFKAQNENFAVSEKENFPQTIIQKLKGLTVKTCRRCGKEYRLSNLAYLYIALIALGIIFTLFVTWIIGLPLLLIGIGGVNSRPCPHCGFYKLRDKDKAREQKVLNKMKNESNNTFYRTLYDLDNKYKAKKICIALLIILAVMMIVPLVTETVDVTFYSSLDVEKSITNSYINLIAKISETWAVILLLTCTIPLAMYISMASKYTRLSIVPRVISSIIAIINIVGIAIFNENRIVEEFYYYIDEWVREFIDRGSASIGAESFWFILINIIVVGLVFILYEFEKAIIINKNAEKAENSMVSGKTDI